MTTTYRRWNWADKVMGAHGDAMHALDLVSQARHEHELSQRWWARRRFEDGMAALMDWARS